MSKTKAILDGIEAESMLYDSVRIDDTQLHFIYDLAQQAPDGIGVEVGAYRGGSIVCWGQARKGRGQIIAVDNRKTQGYKKALIDKLAGYGLDIELLEVDSWDAPALIDKQVAFCFIDAGHKYEKISRDVAVWPDKIMPGGIICFHDYGVWKPTVAVKRVVDKWQVHDPWTYLGIVGALIAFRKPDGNSA